MGTSLKGYVPDIPAPVPLGYPARDMGYGQISRLVPDDAAATRMASLWRSFNQSSQQRKSGRPRESLRGRAQFTPSPSPPLR